MMNKNKNKKQPETGMDRLKKVALWQWGLITIVAGVFANLVMALQGSATGGSAAARGEALGRGVATLLFVGTGVVLIIVDIVRRRR